MSMSVSAGPAKKGKKKFHAPTPEINVTPLVDVMLVLLIIFMITVQAAKDSIPVELPDAVGTPEAGDKTPLEVTLDARGDIHIGNQTFGLEVVEQELPRLLKGHEKQGVTLSAHKKMPYESVVKVVSAIREAGVETVNLAVEGQ